MSGTIFKIDRGPAGGKIAFDDNQRVRSEVPARPRTDHTPLNRREYLLHVLRRV